MTPNPATTPTTPTTQRDRQTERLPQALRGLISRLNRAADCLPIPSAATVREAAALLQTQRLQIRKLQARERQSRIYPWPPNSPAGRLSRIQDTTSLREYPVLKARADVQAVLQTYALLIQVCQAGETGTGTTTTDDADDEA